MQDFRQETDSMGPILVKNDCYWGAQTQRSLQFFNIGQEKMPKLVIDGLVLIKKAAAFANQSLGHLKPEYAKAIIQACDEILQEQWDNQFPLKVWQTGSGTQTHMNVNEVIANRANQILGWPLGTKNPIHPNDHVNYGQSTNDSFPTAMHIAAVQALHNSLFPTLKTFHQVLLDKVRDFKKIVKVGRTHGQDAVPLTLGQEFSAFAKQIGDSIQRLEKCLPGLYSLAQGGTAVGTGLNCSSGFVELFIIELNRLTKLPFLSAVNKFEALASHDSLVELSGSLNTLAVSCMKIANDIRWLSSGPRCGLQEIQLPQNEPGSSIMPGKVNPTQAEALSMVCCQVMGNHATITIAGSQGSFQLNVFKPVIIYNLLQSIQLLAESCSSFTEHCLRGLVPNLDQLHHNVDVCLMLATALTPLVGYDKTAQLVHQAFLEKKTLKEVVVEAKIMTEEEYKRFQNQQLNSLF